MHACPLLFYINDWFHGSLLPTYMQCTGSKCLSADDTGSADKSLLLLKTTPESK